MYENLVNSKFSRHWAEDLQTGDKALACIRHKTDGSKNIHNAEIIVITNNIHECWVLAAHKNIEYQIPYMELKQLTNER